MSGGCATLPSTNENISTGDCEDINKILTVVVKRRKTIPTKCMEIEKEIFGFELQRLENAKIITEESKETEQIRKITQGFKRLQSFQLTLEDLHEAEKKLEEHHEKIRNINNYLEKRKKHVKQP